MVGGVMEKKYREGRERSVVSTGRLIQKIYT